MIRCVALLVASLTLAAATQARAGAPLPDNPLQGRLLFESKGCHQCHGIAENRTGIGPDLGEGHFRGSFLELGAALWNHVPEMSFTFETTGVDWPELSETEIYELSAFLYFIDYLGRPGDPAAGARVFESRSCAACHNVAGRGPKVGPDLAQLQRFASPLFVAQAIWNHGPSMFQSMQTRRIPPPQLNEGDLADLSAFLRQEASGQPQSRQLLAPGNPNRGQELFGDKGCSTCHGGGLDRAPDLRASDLHRSADGIAATMWNHALAMTESMRAAGVAWPKLSTTEMADLVAYLYFLPFDDPQGNPERGARLFTEKSCSDCHESRDTSAHPGPDLAGLADASAQELVAALWNHAPVMTEAILGQGLPWPTLTGEDMRDLLASLAQRSDETPQSP